MNLRRGYFLLLCFTLLGFVDAQGQQSREVFGKNRIQYRQFDWLYLSGENFDVYYYDARKQVAQEALEYLESEFDRSSVCEVQDAGDGSILGSCPTDICQAGKLHTFYRVKTEVYQSRALKAMRFSTDCIQYGSQLCSIDVPAIDIEETTDLKFLHAERIASEYIERVVVNHVATQGTIRTNERPERHLGLPIKGVLYIVNVDVLRSLHFCVPEPAKFFSYAVREGSHAFLTEVHRDFEQPLSRRTYGYNGIAILATSNRQPNLLSRGFINLYLEKSILIGHC